MKRILVAAVTAVFIFPAVAHAASTITAGNYVLTPGEVQTIAILATGNDQVQGVNFLLQVGDGSGQGPTIVDIDLTGPGTIFHANNTGVVDVLNGGTIPPNPFTPGHQAWVGTTTNAGTVLANGILAFVTFYTPEDFNEFSMFDLSLSIPEWEVSTDWAGSIGAPHPVLVNGSVGVVPEPSSLALAALAGCSLLVDAARRRRAWLAKKAACYARRRVVTCV